MMSKIKEIDVGKEFYHRLANRDEKQGDGKHTAIEFRKRFLAFLDDKKVWEDGDPSIILNFRNVDKLGPSFANEAFAYFAQFAKPERILQKIVFKEISNIKILTIKEELETGYRPSLWKKIVS